MAKKEKTVFICQDCGHESVKWMGRCPGCNQWNSMVEEVPSSEKRERLPSTGMGPEKITAVSLAPRTRLKTGISEFDRILGGGIVPGSMVLVGGDPGSENQPSSCRSSTGLPNPDSDPYISPARNPPSR